MFDTNVYILTPSHETIRFLYTSVGHTATRSWFTAYIFALHRQKIVVIEYVDTCLVLCINQPIQPFIYTFMGTREHIRTNQLPTEKKKYTMKTKQKKRSWIHTLTHTHIAKWWNRRDCVSIQIAPNLSPNILNWSFGNTFPMVIFKNKKKKRKRHTQIFLQATYDSIRNVFSRWATQMSIWIISFFCGHICVII